MMIFSKRFIVQLQSNYKLHIIIPAWWKRVKLRRRNAEWDAALLCGVPNDDYFLSDRGI